MEDNAPIFTYFGKPQYERAKASLSQLFLFSACGFGRDAVCIRVIYLVAC